ncbi:MAG: hypothetical protein MHPSP_003561, partial [Paramarteilia canceri]
ILCQKCKDTELKCAKCSKTIEGQVKLDSENRKFHVECFSCESCGDTDLSRGYFLDNKGKVVCMKCKESKANVCSICGNKITSGAQLTLPGSDKENEPQFLHEECFNCSKCSKKITGGKYVLNKETKNFEHIKC